MKATNMLKIQKREQNEGPRVVKRPLTAYRNIGPSSTANSRQIRDKIQAFQTDPDPLQTKKQHHQSLKEAEKTDKDIMESMKQLDWFDKSQLSKNRSNRYPKASYKEAQDYNKRFKELMEQKKLQKAYYGEASREHTQRSFAKTAENV